MKLRPVPESLPAFSNEVAMSPSRRMLVATLPSRSAIPVRPTSLTSINRQPSSASRLTGLLTHGHPAPSSSGRYRKRSGN